MIQGWQDQRVLRGAAIVVVTGLNCTAPVQTIFYARRLTHYGAVGAGAVISRDVASRVVVSGVRARLIEDGSPNPEIESVVSADWRDEDIARMQCKTLSFGEIR